MGSEPQSLKRKISPPPTRSRTSYKSDQSTPPPTPAAVEAGKVDIQDHLHYFSSELEKVRRPRSGQHPSLPIDAFRELYLRNQGPQGRHFVIHQHDHPVAGVHYDLRLQFSETSSLSFSVPYGLPGNPNSLRPNRMAIETRVHNLWNNLIESASSSTGSLLIWDTGEYEVLPRKQPKKALDTDDELSDKENDPEVVMFSQAEKLARAFEDRHMHLRLHSTRLPRGYTIAMRLPKQNMRHKQPQAPKRKRRRKMSAPVQEPLTSESDTDGTSPPTTANESSELQQAAIASDEEGSNALEQETIRKNNAYPGADNSIGSIHQRQWFLSLDREACGFVKERRGPDAGRWVRKLSADGILGGFENFHVMGRDSERSVVTGRLAADAMSDAGIKSYAGRKMWRPITE